MNKNPAATAVATAALTTGPMLRLTRLAPVLALTVLAAGCASVPNPSPNDPWEGYNRSMYAFNDTVDRAVLKPVAKGYTAITPQPVRTCVHNIFNNVGDVWSALNSFLQGRVPDGINTVGRVLFNSTMGLGGCIDVASMNGSKRIANDFGVTLGVWGFKPGPYLVLPFIGPSTLRDGAGVATSFATGVSYYSPVFEIDNIPLRNSILGLSVVDLRASYLDADDLINRTALDKYSFIRDAYLQRRKALIQGMNVDAEDPNYLIKDVPNASGQSQPYNDQSLPQYEDPDAPAAPAAPAPKATQ